MIVARVDEFHHELLKKVDLYGGSSATALQNIQVGDGSANEFLVSSDGDERFS
jgi:hypothetical protein